MGEQAKFWIELLVQGLPLIAIAGSAVVFIWKSATDRANRRYERLLQLMQYIDSQLPLATKLASVYSLRQFTDHHDREFVIRFCGDVAQTIAGSNAAILKKEMEATAIYLTTKRPWGFKLPKGEVGAV